MRRFPLILLVVVALAVGLTTGASAQEIHTSPFWTGFADTLLQSTYNGEPLAIGTVIRAYDQSGTWCGVDTVRYDTLTGLGKFGFFSVYGDDPGTAGVDEGATAGEQIRFTINGHDATVVTGDDTWTDQARKSVVLSATATIAVSAVNLPNDTLILPGDTVTLRVDVQNDGDGLDFYGVKLSMSQPGGTDLNSEWEAFEPDTVVYADVGATAAVYFSIRAPIWSADTTNTVSYTVFSHLDTTQTVTGDVQVIISLTDVDDDPNGLLPGTFVLEQNYPNPFNPTTTMAYNLATAATVRLEVFNVLGRLVDSRDLGHRPAGPGEIVYDASALASGVYLYRLSTESTSRTRKMVLLK